LKKLISLFVIGFLIISGIGSFASKNNINQNFHHITLIDDAFHGTTSNPSIEWWYFDSMFDNDYSIHVGFRILSFNEFQILKTSINIYYKYNLIANETTLISKNNFFVSEIKPLIKIKNEPVMLIDQSKDTQEDYWTYHLNYKINNVGVDLILTGITEGWKYETLYEGWTVALPLSLVRAALCKLTNFIRGSKVEAFHISAALPGGRSPTKMNEMRRKMHRKVDRK